MADIAYKDQSVSGLRLNLIEGRVNVRQFTVLRSGFFSIGSLRAEAGIIGASHFFRLKDAEGWNLTEALACTEVDPADEHIHFTGPLQNLKGGKLHIVFSNRISYLFTARVADLEATWMNQFKIENKSGEDGFTLGYEFPSGDRSIKPRTLILLKREGKKIILRTGHSYPNEGKAVLTQTNIEEMAE